MLASLTIFPVTLSGQFAQRLAGVISPLHGALDAHRTALRLPASGSSPSEIAEEKFQARFAKAAKPALASAAAAEAALVPLRLTSRLLPLDTCISRHAPEELETLHDPARRLAVRAHGLSLFFRLVDVTQAFPLAKTTADEESSTESNHEDTDRSPPNRDASSLASPTLSPTLTRSSATLHHHTLYDRLLHHAKHPHLPHTPGHSTSHFRHMSRTHTQSRSQSRAPSPARVGAFEERTYTAIAERHRPAEDHELYAENATRQLHESTAPLLDACIAGLDEARSWLGRANTGLFGTLFRKRPEECKEKGRIGSKRLALEAALKEFRSEKR
jgi:hypothetical protein